MHLEENIIWAKFLKEWQEDYYCCGEENYYCNSISPISWQNHYQIPYQSLFCSERNIRESNFMACQKKGSYEWKLFFLWKKDSTNKNSNSSFILRNYYGNFGSLREWKITLNDKRQLSMFTREAVRQNCTINILLENKRLIMTTVGVF